MGPSFLDPQTMSNGNPYGPVRFRQIIKECYLIAKNCNTSYTDLLNITPMEKNELINLIIEENKKSEEAMQKIKNENAKKLKTR